MHAINMHHSSAILFAKKQKTNLFCWPVVGIRLSAKHDDNSSLKNT